MGKRVNSVSFPDYSTPLGREIHRFLQGEVNYRPEVRQLLYVANRWEREDDIRKWLHEENYVIADRYMQAGLVYGLANGLGLNWMLSMEKGFRKRILSSYSISLQRLLLKENALRTYTRKISAFRR